jgi:hypothetical protein
VYIGRAEDGLAALPDFSGLLSTFEGVLLTNFYAVFVREHASWGKRQEKSFIAR